MLLPLAGCKQTSIENGQTLTGLSSTTKAPLTVTATLPAGVDAWVIEPNGPGPFSVDVWDSASRLVKTCASAKPCWVATPLAGKYQITFPSNPSLSGLSLATSWGGPDIFTLGVGGEGKDMGGPAGTVKYNSVRVDALESEMRLGIEGAAATDLTAEFLSATGERVQACESAESCTLGAVAPATYFVKTVTAQGTSRLLGTVSWGLVDLQGVWTVKSYQMRMDWYREAAMTLLDVLERITAPNYIYDALMAMAYEQTDALREYGFPNAAREMLWSLRQDAVYAQSLLDRFIRNNPIDLAAEREKVSNWPDFHRESFSSFCDSVGKGGSYLAFKYDQANAQYLYSTGKLTSCVLPAVGTASTPYGLQTGRMVTSSWLTSFMLDDSQVDLTVRTITPTIFEMRVNEDPLTGTRIWFEKMDSCWSWKPAVDFLNSSSLYNGETSLHICATAVREALTANQIPVVRTSPGRPASGYDPYLGELGFEAVPSEGYVPEQGDVAVFPANESNRSGHIQFFDGEIWRSDYRQPPRPSRDGHFGPGFYTNDRFVGKGKIFRYKSKSGC